MIRPSAPHALPADAPTGRILVVDDHRQARESISDILRQVGYQVQCVSSGKEALKLLSETSVDLVITDLQMPGITGLDLVRAIEQNNAGVQVVVVTAHATVASAVEAMRHGAFDYLEKPFAADRLEQLAAKAIGHGQLLDATPVTNGSKRGTATLVGSSAAMSSLRAQIRRIAPNGETVLICGESGTGKELVAQSIHAASPRAQLPLVSLNCPVLSATLLESELFGHEQGAFTGADCARTGRFELAQGGTIFLDEITEMEMPLQAKLLRVLQERTYERVGSSLTRRLDARVLSSTNRNLRERIAGGLFREDLYYRLAVLVIDIPPVRERPEDIAELVQHFTHNCALRQGKEPCEFSQGAMDLLQTHHWPGNVRELENIVTRASVLACGQAITAEDIRPWLLNAGDAPAAETQPSLVGLSLHEMERKLIEATLTHYEGHRAKTATALGIGLRTLTGKLREYGYAPRAKSVAKAA